MKTTKNTARRIVMPYTYVGLKFDINRQPALLDWLNAKHLTFENRAQIVLRNVMTQEASPLGKRLKARLFAVMHKADNTGQQIYRI